MRLSSLNCLTESLQTDFYDVYLLASIPHTLENQEAKHLFIDRVDRLYEEMLHRVYAALIKRCNLKGCFDEDWEAIQDSQNVSTDEAEAINLDHLLNITDPVQMRKTIAHITTQQREYDVKSAELRAKIIQKRKRREGIPIEHYIDFNDYPEYEKFNDKYPWWCEEGSIGGESWTEVTNQFFELTQTPNNPTVKLHKLDKLFGAVHNNGPITDYLDLPWLFDALYFRALADPNEIAQRASIDAQRVTRLDRNKMGYSPVTNDQKRALLRAKQERNPGKSITPDYYEPPEWAI